MSRRRKPAHFAKRVSDRSFRYAGKLSGANSPALNAMPSVDRDGRLYFVSTRSYDSTLATIFQGRFADGTVTGIEIAPGISRRRRGDINFDAEIARTVGIFISSMGSSPAVRSQGQPISRSPNGKTPVSAAAQD